MAPSSKTRAGRCNRHGAVEVPDDDDQGGCSTPKGKSFRIPEALSCPPAPMKAKKPPPPKFCSRVSTPAVAFFAPLEEELDLFFLFAFRKI
ncbi:unnamed protein product [Linum trigynum]